jgi:hypothetical protein
MALTKVHTNIIEGLEEHIGDSDYLPLRGGTITGDLNISTAIVNWEASRLDPTIIYNNPEGMNKNSLVVKGAVTEKVYTWEWTPDQRTHEIDPTNGSIQVSNWPVGYQPGVTWYTIDSGKWENGQSVTLTINMETVLHEDREVMWPDRSDAVHNPNPCEINWINSPASTEGGNPWTGDWTSRNYDTKIVPNSNAYDVLIVKLWKTNDTMYGQRVGGSGSPLLSTSLKGAKSNVSRR